MDFTGPASGAGAADLRHGPYVSIDVSLPTCRSTMAAVSPAELERLGLEPERTGGWEFRGQLEDGSRLQIIAVGSDRDPVVLRRGRPAEFVPDYWRP
jgi:hypothetical protein